MKLATATLLLAFIAASPQVHYFRYERPIQLQAQQAGQACLPIEAEVFAHAAPQLADLRLYANDAETPYTIRVATVVASSQRTHPLLNAGVRDGQTVFDVNLEEDADFSEPPYSDIELNVTAQNFIATVTVSGSHAKSGKPETKLGEFTIFDLSRQRLGRSTVLHLPESNFPHLHFRIAGPLRPEEITGLSVGRAPGAPPRYRTVAETANSTHKDHATIVTFDVPANVPVDRVVFAPGATPAAFSRDVTISAEGVQLNKPANDQQSPSFAIRTSGYLLRIHQATQGKRIDEEKLTADAPREVFDTPSRWTITIKNGDDPPLSLQSVRLEMRERMLCFEAPANAAFTLRYGDPALAAPQYDYARLFSPQANPLQAVAGLERSNPAWQPRPDERPFTEKHPMLLWAALIGVILLLAGIAFKSGKQAPRAT
jgi:hypothetical protein